MFKDFTASADFQLDVCRKRDVFISHSPRHGHIHFHCVIFMCLHVEHTKASLLVIVVLLFVCSGLNGSLVHLWRYQVHFELRNGSMGANSENDGGTAAVQPWF